MNESVLFVDDDRSLLNMLERNFALDFNVCTAQSGPEALEIIQQSEPFAVTMVDMRMPEMEGVEMITHAREHAPDSSYIMLTGNQDLTTAMDAVNQGRVFRFLNKPCEIAEIRRAIEAGMQQFELVTGQKELLNETFTGAVGVLTEIVETMESPIVESNKIKTLAETLMDELGIEASWAMPWTARFFVVGLPLLSEEQQVDLKEQPIFGSAHKKVVRQMIEMSTNLIRKIPRLEAVTEILDEALKSDGSLPRLEGGPKCFATLLLVSFYVDLLQRTSIKDHEIVDELKKRFSSLDSVLTNALEKLLGQSQDGEDDTPQQRAQLDPTKLTEGMIVAADVTNGEDVLLVAEGRRLTAPMIERLRQMAGSHDVKVEVILPK